MLRKRGIKWLTTLDLETFVNRYADGKTKSAFLGVFPINHLPKRLIQLPTLFIINTQTDNLPGQHWKAVFIDKDGKGEIFDSLATPVSLKLQEWMNRFTKKWIISNLTLQNPLSPSCGAYVLYFIMTRLTHNIKKNSPFTGNVFLNDQIVEKFVNNYV